MPLGKEFVGFCIVRKRELKYKSTGEPYLILELGDCSGRLRGRIWNDAQNQYNKLRAGQIVKIKAKVQVFQGTKELKILRLRQATADDPIELSQLLPQSKKDVAQLRDQFFQHVASLRNPHLKRLLSDLFADDSFTERYFKTPAGKLWHHNYLYGMLEHVVAMLEMADVLGKHYPQLNLDLLKTGIICHDIGKLQAYDKEGYIEFSDEGRLIGHIALGFVLISQIAENIPEFPEDLKFQLLHLMLSHEGKREEGSSVVPMTLEAMALYCLNELDSKTNALCRIIEKDALPGSKWSKFIQLLDRFIYIPHKPNQGESQNDEA